MYGEILSPWALPRPSSKILLKSVRGERNTCPPTKANCFYPICHLFPLVKEAEYIDHKFMRKRVKRPKKFSSFPLHDKFSGFSRLSGRLVPNYDYYTGLGTAFFSVLLKNATFFSVLF